MKNDVRQIAYIKEYKGLIEKYYDIINVPKKNKTKLKGAINAYLMRKYISDVIKDNNLDFDVSENNVFILGYPIECDLLIVKKNAIPAFKSPYIYQEEDVVAVIECKSTGVFPTSSNPKNVFENELKMVKTIEEHGHNIKFGYLVLAEEITRTKNTYLELANKDINEYISEEQKNTRVYCFAKTYPENEYPIYEGNPQLFEDFVLNLCHC